MGTSYFSMGFPIKDGIADILQMPSKFLKKFYDDPLKYSGSALILISIISLAKHKQLQLLLAPLIVLLAYFVFILKSGKWFFINGYYFVMYVPALSLIAAFGLNYLKRNIAILLLVIVIIENLANQFHVFSIRESYSFYTKLESTFDNIGSTRNDLIIVGCDECSAAPIYMSHRKGITIQKDVLLSDGKLAQLKNDGFTYLLIQKRLHGISVTLPYEIKFENDDFCIYKL
jgi:hypothetical protein